MRMRKFKQEGWRGGEILQFTQQFNIQAFKHIYWFPNELGESLELLL